MRREERSCSCAGCLLSCGETSSGNPAAGKAPGTGLGAATSGKSSVPNVVQRWMKLRLKYGWVGKIKPVTGNTGLILQQDMMKFSIQTRGSCSGVAKTNWLVCHGHGEGCMHNIPGKLSV